MENTPLRNQRINRKKPLIVKSLVIMLLLSFFMASSLFIIYVFPYFKKVELNPTKDIHIYYMGHKVQLNAVEIDGNLYLPFDFIKKEVDPTIVWDEKSKIAIITTDQDVFHFPLGKRDGLLNLEPYQFAYPVVEYQSNIYLPIEPIDSYYNFDLDYHQANSIVVIHDKEEPLIEGVTIKESKLRQKPETFSPYLYNIGLNKELYVMREEQGWFWVETNDGLMGYISKDDIRITNILTTKIEKKIYQPWNPIGKPIVLTWEYTTRPTIKTKDIGDLSSVQVVSPTWFHLKQDGLVSNSADMNYVKWAHENGYQVWALFSNSFNKDLTHDMLSNPNLRIKVIKQLLSYVDMYDLDGINLDIENVYVEDKEPLVQFVRELTPLLHEKDRTISIDVTFKSQSENWSMFYDREKLGEIVDYIIVMAYDEHWSSSPIAGSVASLPWVEKGVNKLLKEVPNDKIILGVPFYTRLWKEEKDETGSIQVSSDALTMEKANKWITENNIEIQYDSKSGQHYAEYTKNDITYKMWLEDNYSMEKRISLMKKYRLAGIAAWRRGYETEQFWKEIAQFIQKR